MKKRKKPGPPPLGKITVTIRMYPKTKYALDKAAHKAGKQLSEYLEERLLADLKAQEPNGSVSPS